MNSTLGNIGNIPETAILKCENEILDAKEINKIVKIFENVIANQRGTIGIFLPRNKYLLPAMFACVRLDVPFLLLDNHLPLKRIEYMIKNSQCKCVISKSSCFIQCYQKYKTIVEDISMQYDPLFPVENFDYSRRILYHQYTSGSTGVPKGIEIPESSMRNFIYGIVETINFKISDVVAALTASSFDIFLLETLVSLHLGLTVCLCEDYIFENPRKIIKWIINNSITVLQLTPSRFQQLLYLDRELNFLNSIEEILIGGEMFNPAHLKLLQKKKNLKIYNLYGPAETTVWVSVADLTHSSNINIGKPIRNTKFWIMSPSMEEVKNNHIGEICISGDSLAMGYIRNEELTAKSFVTIKSGERVYKTGDLGMQIKDDQYICLGRIDNQIRGNRVELEEIEQSANLYCEIKDSLAMIDDNNGISKLILLYVSHSDRNISEKQLITFLKQRLPDYMIPSKLVKVEKLQLNTNGKKDRIKNKVVYERGLKND